MVYRHGGHYTLDGNSYTEYVEFENASTDYLVGNAYVFDICIEENGLCQTGLDNPWTEDWERCMQDLKHTAYNEISSGMPKGEKS